MLHQVLQPDTFLPFGIYPRLQAPQDRGGMSADGRTPGPVADVSWLFVAPEGIKLTLKWISRRYDK